MADEVDVRNAQDAVSWRMLKQVLGYWQNSTDQRVVIDQDDATRTFYIQVGSNGPFSKLPRKYYGDSLNSALQQAIDAGEGDE